MNREILFRGKQTDNGEWVYGWYCPYPFGRFPVKDAIVPSEEAMDGCHTFVKIMPDTIGQFTGLFDKNGKRVFEGDVVRCIYAFNKYDLNEFVYVVVWDQEEFGFKATNGKENYGNHFAYLGNCDEIEVIGNIHDNPDKIGGESK